MMSREVETPAGGLAQDREAHASGVPWGAVIGGAFVASALYLILPGAGRRLWPFVCVALV
jgi:hypothetical protein